MNQFKKLFEKQKLLFNTDVTKSYEWRIEQLNQMQNMLQENDQAFYQALSADFKSALSDVAIEVNAPIGIIEFTKSQLKDWMEPQDVPIPKFLSESGHRGKVYREPFGVTLIVGPFNAPLLCTLVPAIAALSAGNTVILKTHEALKATSALLRDLIAKYFEEEALAVVEGDKQALTELLQLPFNFIFFTGSTHVGKIVMRAAAENLTPVILELGGQNPSIVDETANIADAARKLVWGATAWGGQWCSSPGYVYVHESKADEFIAAAKKALLEFYGALPVNGPDLSGIISTQAADRLLSLIDPEKVVAGGNGDAANKYLAPTLIYPAEWTDEIMKEEIFGPILPIMTYTDIKEAVNKIKEIGKPLSAYIFSQNEEQIAFLINTLSFGGGAVNQSNVQLFIVTMPFGGVGSSGMGNYMGKWGFDSLTNPKGVLTSPADREIKHLYPPFDTDKLQELNKWFVY